MITTTRTWTRPNTNIPWWTNLAPAEYKAYIREKYDVTGKRVSSELTISKDKLTLTSVTVFINKAAFEEFSSDPIFKSWIKTRREYCTKNNIIESSIIIAEE